MGTYLDTDAAKDNSSVNSFIPYANTYHHTLYHYGLIFVCNYFLSVMISFKKKTSLFQKQGWCSFLLYKTGAQQALTKLCRLIYSRA